MRKIHAIPLVALLALASAAGVFAVTRTTHLGMAARPHAARVADATIAAAQARLAAAERSLDRQLRHKLPPLPRLPKLVSSRPAAPVQYAAAAPSQVVYVQAAPPPQQAAAPARKGEPGDNGGGRDD